MIQGRRVTQRRSALRADLTILGLVGVLLIAALGAGGLALYQQVYSPTAFVQRYLELLATGRAADALRVPGVSVDLALLEDTSIDATASEALLRTAALAPISDYHVSQHSHKGDVYEVMADYEAAGVNGSTLFRVVQDGWIGIAPNWRFERSPLAEVELTVRGADTFSVNGFGLDRRQVSVHGADAAPLDPVHLLVFTPGVYSITVDTAIASSAGVRVLADTPDARTPIDIQAMPTEKFSGIVQQKVEEFLTACTSQEVLMPTGCPFGLELSNRVADGTAPKWSITQQPQVHVVPDGQSWKIPATEALAHIDVSIKSIFDGSVRKVSEDVPFQIEGAISILPDGTVSIRVGAASDRD